MLYDPKWEQKTEAPSLAGFIAWLETKNPKGRYDFDNCEGRCLIGQYMGFMGIAWGDAPTDPNLCSWADTNYLKTGRQIFGTATFHVAFNKPWTYGAALKRAREFLALTSTI